MVNISLLFMQFIYDFESFTYKNNKKILNKKYSNYKLKKINSCFICHEDLSNKTIYRGYDLSFCCENHRNCYLKI